MKQYIYPFEFSQFLLSDETLKALGAEFWGGSGDFMDAAIDLFPGDKENKCYRFHQMDEMEDEDEDESNVLTWWSFSRM